MLFKEDGASQWCPTAAELLASYAASFAFGHLEKGGGSKNLRMAITGGTDNKSNLALQEKNMSTKWPLLAVQMQVSSQLLANGVRMRLRWRPREENVPADAITNGDHSLFDVKNRVEFSLDDLPLSFFRELCASRNEFMSLRETQVDVKPAEGKQSKRQKLASKTAW